MEEYRRSINDQLVIKRVDSFTENNQEYIESLVNKIRLNQVKIKTLESDIKEIQQENLELSKQNKELRVRKESMDRQNVNSRRL